jgi:hypothetical protein
MMRNLATLSLTLTSAAAFQIGEIVKTTSGPVQGHASTWQPTVSEYLGIPFAQPPIGPLRFEAPVAFNGSKTIVAQKFVSVTQRSSIEHKLILEFSLRTLYFWLIWTLLTGLSDCPTNVNELITRDKLKSPKGIVFASVGQFGVEFSEGECTCFLGFLMSRNHGSHSDRLSDSQCLEQTSIWREGQSGHGLDLWRRVRPRWHQQPVLRWGASCRR